MTSLQSHFFKNAHLSSHFAPAFFFLTPERRKALRSLYAVFRLLDDAVDREGGNPAPLFEAWRDVFQRSDPARAAAIGQGPLAKEFLKVAERYDIPMLAMNDFLEKGVSMDLVRNRFQTPMDVEIYCYGVAGTVGLACLPIFGVPWMEAKDFAVRLGITVQWINIIRDVGVDARAGRVYLPLDHLEQFNYTMDDLFARRNDEAFQALVRHEAGIARSHYKRAMELLPPRWFRELLPARIMGHIYRGLLEKLERKGFPVLTREIRLNTWEKIKYTWKAVREKHDENILEISAKRTLSL
ncbi:MAG: phytoene/squalene synthase family protein [Elusimicrobia bacterium]|nr:phytoene/squalene synthase family protein [Candidatus Obscuribacterium magneticum]